MVAGTTSCVSRHLCLRSQHHPRRLSRPCRRAEDRRCRRSSACPRRGAVWCRNAGGADTPAGAYCGAAAGAEAAKMGPLGRRRMSRRRARKSCTVQDFCGFSPAFPGWREVAVGGRVLHRARLHLCEASPPCRGAAGQSRALIPPMPTTENDGSEFGKEALI